jgi:DtxR family Mn-dependent transcriptional regulator
VLTKDRAREDYAKAIHQLGGGEPVAAVDLARYLGVSRAAVTKFRRVLESCGLVRTATTRTEPIRLTARGQALAIGMIRRHRLVETFLHRTLDVPLDKLHAQAEAIEHVISDEVADRLERFLGNPDVDPHGHPIGEGPRARPHALRTVLSQAPAGSRIRIEVIPDRDPSIVRRLVSQHVLPGLTARVIDRDSTSVTLRSARRTHVVSRAAAAGILVSADDARSRR